MHELDKCLIFRQMGSQIAEGYIHRFEDGTMKIYPQGLVEPLQPGEDVFAFVYSSVMGECKYAGTVRRVTDFCIEVGRLRLVSSNQKRESTRVNKRMEYCLSEYFTDGAARRLVPSLDIVILNISASGICFACEKKLETGFSFPLVLKETARPVSVRAEVLRREKHGFGYHYGARFVGISERDIDEIFRFVFREQIAQRRRSRLI